MKHYKTMSQREKEIAALHKRMHDSWQEDHDKAIAAILALRPTWSREALDTERSNSALWDIRNRATEADKDHARFASPPNYGASAVLLDEIE